MIDLQRQEIEHLWDSKRVSLPHHSGRLMKLHCLCWSERVVRPVPVMVRSTPFGPFSTTKHSNLQDVIGNLISPSNIKFICQLLLRGKTETTWQCSWRWEAYWPHSHSQCSLPSTAVCLVVAVSTCPPWSILSMAIFRDFFLLICCPSFKDLSLVH